MREVSTPFTPEQVKNLFEFQIRMDVHPYTCANRNDGNHHVIVGDLGVLIPTIHGWICPFCNYTQNWAHKVPASERTDV